MKKSLSVRGTVAVFRSWLVSRSEILWPVVFGAAIRFVYVWYTPYNLRTHDVAGHIEYVKYVAQTFTIPHTGQNWEAHQGPVYYFLAGIWVRLGNMFDRSSLDLARDLQWGSMILSVALLWIAGLIALELFPGIRRRAHRTLFVLLHAVIPALVYGSARISNDALAWPLLWLFALLLLRWWRSGTLRDWTWLCVLSAVIILTKHNGYILPPIAFACLLLRPHLSTGIKIRKTALLAASVIVIAGWFLAYRFIDGFFSYGLLAPSLWGMENLRIPNDPEAFLTFNPLRMIVTPFNSPSTNAFGRQFFWEYLLKSVFLGEFIPTSTLLLTVRAAVGLGMAFALTGLVGIWRAWKTRAPFFLPMLIVAAAHVGGLIAYRILHPCACNQDFRFITLALVPWSFFALLLIPLREGWIRTLLIGFFAVLSVVCTVLLLALTLPLELV